MTNSSIYCIDSSSLIDGYIDVYPYDIFVGLWSRMEELVEQGRLRAPEDIFDEQTDQQDDLYDWAKAHRKLFVEVGSREEDRLRKMLAAFPQLADPIKSKSCASSADQILVAMAAANRYVLVSEESAGSRTKPKIQELCELLRVERIRFLDIVKREGWKFP